MNFNGLTVEDWFLTHKKESFPNEFEYVDKYKSIKQAITANLRNATRGGDASDHISLTWHDESHIKTVIKRATKLLEYDRCHLSAYETYYL